MTTILTIGYTSYALPGYISDPDLVKLLSLTRGMRPVETQHSEDYKTLRLVFKGNPERITLSVEPDSEIMEADAWEKFQASISPKKGPIE